MQISKFVTFRNFSCKVSSLFMLHCKIIGRVLKDLRLRNYTGLKEKDCRYQEIAYLAHNSDKAPGKVSSAPLANSGEKDAKSKQSDVFWRECCKSKSFTQMKGALTQPLDSTDKTSIHPLQEQSVNMKKSNYVETHTAYFFQLPSLLNSRCISALSGNGTVLYEMPFTRTCATYISWWWSSSACVADRIFLRTIPQ